MVFCGIKLMNDFWCQSHERVWCQGMGLRWWQFSVASQLAESGAREWGWDGDSFLWHHSWQSLAQVCGGKMVRFFFGITGGMMRIIYAGITTGSGAGWQGPEAGWSAPRWERPQSSGPPLCSGPRESGTACHSSAGCSPVNTHNTISTFRTCTNHNFQLRPVAYKAESWVTCLPFVQVKYFFTPVKGKCGCRRWITTESNLHV